MCIAEAAQDGVADSMTCTAAHTEVQRMMARSSVRGSLATLERLGRDGSLRGSANNFGQGGHMRNLRKLGVITATVLVVAGTSVTLPTSADARWGGGWHGGGWHGGHGGWGWGGLGVGLGTGLLVGAVTAAPYYGGYYGSNEYYGGQYDYGYPGYAADYGYAPDYAYYDEPYDSGYYGYGGPYVSYGYSNYRRPYYRNGGYYARAHSYRSGSYARTNSRDGASYARSNTRAGGSYAGANIRGGGSYARANAREGGSYGVRPQHVRNSSTHQSHGYER